MKTKELIGVRLKRLRKGRKLSQEALAEKVGISSKYVSSIERGKENPTLDVMIKLAHALRVEMEEIFAISHDESNPKKLRDSVNRLLKEADGDKLQMVVRLLRGVLH